MSQSQEDRGSLALILLAASFLVVLVFQMSINLRLKGEQEAMSKQLAEIQEQRTPLVEQAKKVQSGLQALAEDLLKLAETDSDAAALIKQFNIQRNDPAPAPSPAP